MSTEPMSTKVGGRLVPPVAAGTRTEWSALPAAVRDWVGTRWLRRRLDGTFR